MEKAIKSIATNYGLYLGIFSIIILLIMYLLNIEKNWTISIVSFSGTISIFIFGIKAFKKKQLGVLKLNEAIKVGLAIAAIGGVIAALYTYFHYSYIQPEFIENIREQALEEMTKKSTNLTNEQLQKANDLNNMFTSPFAMSTFTLIGNLIIGIISSLFIGLIMKKEQ